MNYKMYMLQSCKVVLKIEWDLLNLDAFVIEGAKLYKKVRVLQIVCCIIHSSGIQTIKQVFGYSLLTYSVFCTLKIQKKKKKKKSQRDDTKATCF